MSPLTPATGTAVHILHVTPYFPPTWAYGGIPRIVYGLGRALLQRGHRISIFTTDALDAQRRNRVPADRTMDGMQVLTATNLSNHLAYEHQLFLPHAITMPHSPAHLWYHLRGAGSLLDSLSPAPDLVHLHGHRHLLNNIARRYALQQGIPWVFTANGTLPRIERKQSAKWLWDILFSNDIPRQAARCVAVSRAEYAHYRAAGVAVDCVRLIPNGLDLGEFQPLPPRGTFKARLGLAADTRVVAYLGRLSPRKGVEHLVEAFSHDPPAGATLVVAGNEMGLSQPPWRSVPATAPIHFVGLLEGADRIALLVDADVLVYPSSDEIFGLVPFEGLLSGAPVVVGSDCGCGQLIQEAGAGLLVRHGDVPALRQQVATLLADPTLSTTLVERGRQYIHRHLGWPLIAEQHEALYREVLDASSSFRGEGAPPAPIEAPSPPTTAQPT